jgi:hypothetical protein
MVAETQSARAGVPAGAIPTVDFLLHDFGRVVKKVRVKTHDSILKRLIGGEGPGGQELWHERHSETPASDAVDLY